jgi:VIT1/CCC1 family predicted Fe2+/Mn2+ transporter
MRRLLKLQRMEATEAEVYRRLALLQKNPINKNILNKIALEEERHQSVIAEITGQKVFPYKYRIVIQILFAKIFGLTFSVKLMENMENNISSEYRSLGLHEIAEEEEEHERVLIKMLDEERLKYSSSIVLGMSDALIELTGALAGLTFAFRDVRLVALVGLITGISAAFSMGASEYLSSRAEGKNESAIKAAFFTWLSYIITVLLLISPYIIIEIGGFGLDTIEYHVQALACTFIVGIIIVASFNFYISIVEEVSFKIRFLEMISILIVISVISYGIGVILRDWIIIEM